MIVRRSIQPTSAPVCLLLLLWMLGTVHAADDADPHPAAAYKPGIETQELCGWVELETWESDPYPQACLPPQSGTDVRCYSRSVSVRQVVQPFAMVGTAMEGSLDAVRRFQAWWDDALARTSQEEFSASDLAELEFLRIDLGLDSRLKRVPSLLDERALGQSVLVERFRGEMPDPVSLSTTSCRQDVLAGCSPMIHTIEETYMAYDMVNRDVRLWCVFPTTTRPHCICNHVAEVDASTMWDEFDQVVIAPTVSAADATAAQLQCSAFCMLDLCLEKLPDWVGQDAPIQRALQPQMIGRQLVELAVKLVEKRDRLAEKAARAFARCWRRLPADLPRPSAAGQALLARAGATAEATRDSERLHAAAETNIAEALPTSQRR